MQTPEPEDTREPMWPVYLERGTTWTPYDAHAKGCACRSIEVVWQDHALDGRLVLEFACCIDCGRKWERKSPPQDVPPLVGPGA